MSAKPSSELTPDQRDELAVLLNLKAQELATIFSQANNIDELVVFQQLFEWLHGLGEIPPSAWALLDQVEEKLMKVMQESPDLPHEELSIRLNDVIMETIKLRKRKN